LTVTLSCGDNPIGNLNNPGTMYHLIEDPAPTVASWSLWTVKRDYCVKTFDYSISPSMLEITPEWDTPPLITVTGTPKVTNPALI
jgi:hypothetical protein